VFDLIAIIICLILGMIMALFPKRVAHITVRFDDMIHVFHPSEAVSRIFFQVFGFVFLILGILQIFGVI
jgi:hypothetical protein